MIIRKFVSGMDLSRFSSGDAALDAYLKTRAGQDMRRGCASVFAALEDGGSDRVTGFYSLTAASIDFSLLPPDDARHLPRYPQVPAVRLGRLAVDRAFQKRNIGKMLLLDAIRRSCLSEIAWAFFLVDANDERATAFYEKFYFSPLADNHLAMWLKRKQAEQIARMLLVV